MATTSNIFEVMSELTGSIKQLDKIEKQRGENLLENAFVAVKEINLEELDEDIKVAIIGNIREGLVRLYQRRQIVVNKEIGLGIEFTEAENTELDEEDIKAKSGNILSEKVMSDNITLNFPTNRRFTDMKINNYLDEVEAE